mmetsp:Transcript_27530/g.66144  ORF Transcript_27530/g.66144 Transcript_27530/m.66144 type:complete len:204 (-) Transcript_27530:910-1521(-)
MFRHFIPHVCLQELRQFRTLQFFCHWSRRRCFWASGLLTLFDRAPWTCKFRPLILVLASVEKSTDLVDPTFATIALNPALFVQLIILLLQQCLLPDGQVAQFEELVWFEIIKALLAPVILVISSHEVVGIATDALRWTASAVAIEDRRLKQKLLTAAERTCLPIAAFCVLFFVKLLLQHFEVFAELDLHFLRHVVDDGTFGVI